MKEKLKTNKGITLIALIITIILLLILAIVSISIVVNNGIISKTKEGAIKYKEEELKEASYLNSIIDKYYTNQDSGENNQNANNTPSPNLKEGAKVKLDGIDYTILYVNNDGTVEMITDGVMGNLMLGSSDTQAEGNNDFEKAVDSYNNAVTRLNEYCESLYKDENGNYKNSNIISVRSVGSNRNNPNADTQEYYTDPYISTLNCSYSGTQVTVNNVGKVEDNNYEEDYNKMKELGIENCGNAYWLASRRVFASSSNVVFSVRNMNSGRLDGGRGDLWYATSYGYACSHAYCVRPVLKVNYSALQSK